MLEIPELVSILTGRSKISATIMLILYALLIIAFSSSVVANPPSDIERNPPKAIEHNNNDHLSNCLWVRFGLAKKPEDKSSWEDRNLDDVMKFVPVNDGSGIVSVIFSKLERELVGRSWRTKLTQRPKEGQLGRMVSSESSNVRLADLNKESGLLPLEGYWGHSDEIVLPTYRKKCKWPKDIIIISYSEAALKAKFELDKEDGEHAEGDPSTAAGSSGAAPETPSKKRKRRNSRH
ncbi:hypothetical protein AX14_012545 [Amanita brunnescens Koide BX004]|nr:hypothetical protein AX14_012545 [Amanita brunnescens Koide BX004]